MLYLNLKPKANFIKNKNSSPRRRTEDIHYRLFNNNIRDITNDFLFFLVNFHFFLILIYFCDLKKMFQFYIEFNSHSLCLHNLCFKM